MTAIDYVDKTTGSDFLDPIPTHLLHYQITHLFLFFYNWPSGLKFGCLNLTMDVGMDENWATIAIEQLGLPILGVLGNFFFNLGIWTDLTWRCVTDRPIDHFQSPRINTLYLPCTFIELSNFCDIWKALGLRATNIYSLIFFRSRGTMCDDWSSFQFIIVCSPSYVPYALKSCVWNCGRFN
jgi:hypothetical protein